jgi:hypothetical protein
MVHTPQPALAGVRLFSCTLETGAFTKRGECAGSRRFLNLPVYEMGACRAVFHSTPIGPGSCEFSFYVSGKSVFLRVLQGLKWKARNFLILRIPRRGTVARRFFRPPHREVNRFLGHRCPNRAIARSRACRPVYRLKPPAPDSQKRPGFHQALSVYTPCRTSQVPQD